MMTVMVMMMMMMLMLMMMMMMMVMMMSCEIYHASLRLRLCEDADFAHVWSTRRAQTNR